MMLHRIVLLVLAAILLVGCGPNTDDKSRVPKDAPNTDDPSKVMMGGSAEAPTMPKGGQAGPGAAKGP